MLKLSPVLLFVLAFPAAPAADPPTLPGYPAAASALQREWEAKFRDIPATGNLREYVQRLSARPHHLGSPYDEDNARWLLAKLKSWGLDARIETFDVLFPTPAERAVEMTAPRRFVAKLEEPAVPADPTSSQHSEQLPTYN